MLLNFVRLTGDGIYKIYEPLRIKLLTRGQLGFSHSSEHKFRHKFADSLNPLCSCSLETVSLLHFFLCRAIMTELKNISDAIMSLKKMIYFMLHCMATRILTTT